jgi:heat shock protein HspQ
MSEKQLTPKHRLGATVRDSITGYEGVIIGVTFWLNGCTRVGVQSREMKDGIPKDAQWFDEMQLESTEAAVEPTQPKRGGPMPDPKQ